MEQHSGPDAHDRLRRIPREAGQADAAVTVVGQPIPALRLGTDPLVYAAAAALPEGGIFSAVVPRSALPLVDLEFVTAHLD